jgi:hypothetical protein
MTTPADVPVSRTDLRSVVFEVATLMRPLGHLHRCAEWSEESETVRALNRIFGLTLPESIVVNLAIADRGCVVALGGAKDAPRIPRLFVRYLHQGTDDIHVLPALIGGPDTDEHQITSPWPPPTWSAQAAIAVMERLILLAASPHGDVQ